MTHFRLELSRGRDRGRVVGPERPRLRRDRSDDAPGQGSGRPGDDAARVVEAGPGRATRTKCDNGTKKMLHSASAAIILLKCWGENYRMPQQSRRGAPPAPRPRGLDEPGGDDGGAGVRGREAGDERQLPAQLCDAPVGGERRHPHGARTPRPRRPGHDDDRHARAEQRRSGRPQPPRRLKPAQCAIVGWLARSSD